ncbi:hypothetical protein ACSBL2_14695 [Pedobacter sp. AW31-3R]|uniref:hypothetical protein n=1 Tax=Pedobacter sp. AW31-3R TaxID=3445781 RepID=UPI003FA001BA
MDNNFLCILSLALSQVILLTDHRRKLRAIHQSHYITLAEMPEITSVSSYEIVDLQFPVSNEGNTLQKKSTTYWMKNYPLN